MLGFTNYRRGVAFNFIGYRFFEFFKMIKDR
ncbi:MAG: hypothetical protein ACI956_000198, partial [Nonlabens sp.]